MVKSRLTKPLKIGLTGGIGSGKSTVSEIFRKLGVTIIDADDIAHRLVEPGERGYQAILKHFGIHITDASGALDRRKLRQIIFSDAQQKQALEDILHPLVYQEIRRLSASVIDDYCIIVIPLLMETGGENHIDRLLVVDCPEEIQIQRAVERDNASHEDITAIMSTQATRRERLAKADDVIRNDADLTSLEQQVRALDSTYRSMAA